MSERRVPLPLISQSDYEAVLRLLSPHVTYTYDEWLDLRAKWIARHAEDGIIEVGVNPDEFARFLAVGRHANDLNALFAFANSLVWK